MAGSLLKNKRAMETFERRNLLSVGKNPDPRLDYVTSLSGQMAEPGAHRHSSVVLRYVPDRLILDPSAFGRYLDAMGAVKWSSLEEAAATLLNDISNELVARWVQVSISAPDGVYPGIASHDVLLEDRQPNWENAGLLSRLGHHRSDR